ncbi:capsule biosynthesis protein CapA [Listeria newyorkensis]|uniref:Capsule biosynthesis protein CapA n=1 Tax=Listeria newyorkensis TaxID=1497681 RepID=A0ABX4XIK7_9LIST|nr:MULTISPECIES: Wzz/FepE/Etk N-terminal domain-containing protein [Listeria]KGL37372.1 capsule biosynthesis protein CapA [Listeriaceae bacterium FSL A5-0209]KGL37848.1 capsule biosynthesis protein CapA [Listeria newyorkensis]PNP88359.1 capsule biosynthesis protein CapA [Listeria newyorkensis]RQW66028.1 capsule biosynthesis protein CapA [Listeria sp. SHR_NRA_18]SQC56638.1 Capsular polysaccharide type 8 biosynthesis protein cap8A [Listeria newyorkensis]
MKEAMKTKQILRSFKKSWYWLIIVPAILVMLTFGIEKFWITPNYTTSTQVLVTTVTPKNETQASDSVRSSIQLSDTYSTTIGSARTMQEVIDKYKLDMTPAELASKVTVKGNINSLVFTITVVDSSPEQAELIANGIASVVQSDFPDLFSGTKMINLEKASEPVTVSSMTKYILAAGFGLGIALVIVLYRASYDNIIRQRESFDDIGLRFLGDIPLIEGE